MSIISITHLVWILAKWCEENYVDDEGRTNPMDFSFDEWEKMKVPSSWNYPSGTGQRIFDN
ncbi:hypothetical protein [Paenibacillus sp. N3.4]|uniref:hypothetical protein n=1 Tax=Paenibacillus sp. N3.4 TaxID=2603222 RepID=UPI001C9C88A5|nr:hypothetical protein [Paenibacillus sp. N3.4]